MGRNKKKEMKIRIPSCQLHLPQITGHDFVGCSDGFLFTINDSLDIQATNPLTGAQLPFPPTASLPTMVAVERDPSNRKITEYVYKRLESNQELMEMEEDEEPNFKRMLYEDYTHINGKTSLLVQFDNEKIDTMPVDTGYMRHYYKKVILSPSLDTVVVLLNSHGVQQELAFARVQGGGSSSSSSSWTAPYLPPLGCNDIIFHDGRLHAIAREYVLFIFDDDLDNPWSPHFRSLEDYEWKDLLKDHCDQETEWFDTYLVDSPDGRDLFLLCRGLIKDMWPARTKNFKVFKLDKKDDYKWKIVESIGDFVFFVGAYSHSLSFSALDFPSGLLKPNCIYFTDGTYSSKYADVISDSGIFHLEDGTVEQFYRGIYNFNSHPPTWFTPSPIC